MATTEEFRERVRSMSKQLCEEIGEISVSEEECWLAVVEEVAAEMGDAMATGLIEGQSAAQTHKTEADCPKCGKRCCQRGSRERELITRRGPATIFEPEFYCTCCRKSFFPDGATDRR